MTIPEPDLRPCPGCRRMIADADDRYAYPGTYTAGGAYVDADEQDLLLGFWRCGGCIGKDTRAWRELGRPSGTRPTPDFVLRLGDDEP